MRGAIGALLIGLMLILAAPVMAAVRSPTQVPSVPVQVPPVDLPSLPVPVPTVQAAPVPVPQVQLPPVPAPPVTTVPAPARALPGSAPSAARGSTGRVRDTAAAPSGGGSAPSTAGGTGTAAPGGSAPAVMASSRAAEKRRSARERRFRRTVRRLAGCLEALPRLSQRVLVLRAGVGEQDVLTLAQTARRVDRRERAVRRIQRRAVRRLKAAERAGRCDATAPDGAGATSPVTTVAGSEFAVAGVTATGTSGAVTGSDTGGSGGGDDQGSTGGGSGDRGGVKGEQREKQGRRKPSFPGSLIAPAGKGIPSYIWIALALGGLAWFAVTRIRRRRRIDRLRYY